MILEKIRLFLLENCPLFSENGIKVNFLGEIPRAFSINSVSVNPIVKNYSDGGSLRQFVFTITSREFYDSEDKEALSAMSFFDGLSQWIEEANSKNLLPDLENGLLPVALSVVSTEHKTTQKAARAVYEIKCKLLYEKKGVFNL